MNPLTVSLIAFFVVFFAIVEENVYRYSTIHVTLEPQGQYTIQMNEDLSSTFRLFNPEEVDISVRVYRDGLYDKRFNMRTLRDLGVEGLQFSAGVSDLRIINIGDNAQTIHAEITTDGAWGSRFDTPMYILALLTMIIIAGWYGITKE